MFTSSVFKCYILVCTYWSQFYVYWINILAPAFPELLYK